MPAQYETRPVVGYLKRSKLAMNRSRNIVFVITGIAWDAVGKRLFVTGKWWPKLFEVALSQLKGGRANAAAIEQARKRCIPQDTNVF